MAVDLDTVLLEIKTYYNEIMEAKFDNGEQKYTDLNDWMSTAYPATVPEKLTEFAQKLQDLYGKCCSVMDVVKESRCQVYPDYPTEVTHMDLHLWQMGFSADSFIRGATAAYNVFRCMEADVQKGGMTSKYPIEIVPFLGTKGPGEAIAPFEIMAAIGASVVTSAYLICHWVIEKGHFNDVALEDVTEKARLAPLANVIISVMHIRAMHEPVKDMKDAAFKSNQGKITAGQRPQPTILSYVHAYSRVAIEAQKKNKTWQTHRELVMEQVNQHNQREKVRKDKIKTDEISSMGNVLLMSEWFMRRLKIIFQYQKPSCTSVPYVLLSAKFLSASSEPSVKKEENPVWYSIEEWSREKADAWLARTDGRFNYKVKEQIAKGKKPNLVNQAKDFRDTGNEHSVWVMACLKVWAWPEASKVNSAHRLKDLEEAWQRGALDETLRIHVINKRKDFKASDLSWAGSGSQDVSESSGALCDVDPLGQQQQELTEAQRRSIASQFQEWAKMLQIEGGRHKLWLTEAEAFDSRRESDLQRFRNDRAILKTETVEKLCDSHYCCQGFDKKDKALTYMKSRLVSVSDIPPAKPIGSVLRLLWADMAQLGLSHSRHTAEIFESFNAACEHHPDVTGCILFMPNTPKSGKGLKADALREDNIKDAVNDVKNTLLTYGALAHQAGHCIIDPDTMYSTDRPCTMEFSSIISKEQTPDGKYRSLFSKGYAFRRLGVPELIKVMHRSQFVDTGNKLTAASRGNLGEEKERKHWHSGRSLYKTMLKYIFQDMGLTPGARVLVQHLTAWDHEFAVACMEQNAAKAMDMPTIMYVASGWAAKAPEICKNLSTMMSEELSNLIEKGTYTIPGFDAHAQEPHSQKRPELDDSVFKICKPRYSSKELAIMQSELTRAQALFSIDAGLKKTFDHTVEEFNKVHNPSGIPWKEVKRPREAGESGSQFVEAGESESRGVFLTPCSKAAKDLEAENCFVFKHTANPKYDTEFKLYISEDGSKLYLQCSQDGIFFCPMGRFVGSFLQGQPAKTAMSGGSQWIEWKYDNLESIIVACKKESSMAGPDVLPAYTHEPGTLKKFLEHLDKCGKIQYSIVSHKVERDDIGRVTGITPEETTCLPLPTTMPSKKKYSLENIAGYVDIDAVKKSKYLQIVHNLVCPIRTYVHTCRVQNIKSTYIYTHRHIHLHI